MTFFFFFSSRRRHTRWPRDWSSDVCSSDLADAHDRWRDDLEDLLDRRARTRRGPRRDEPRLGLRGADGPGDHEQDQRASEREADPADAPGAEDAVAQARRGNGHRADRP